MNGSSENECLNILNPFSVSICVYGKDNPEWFHEALQSVLNQTVRPNEIVLVVDGPVPDELNQIICTYEDNPIFKVIRFAENRGHGYARRAGLEVCSNEVVALMDADDICVANRFEQQIFFFEDREVAIVGGDIIEFSGSIENIISKRVVPCSDSEIKEYMKKRCPFNQMTVMFRKRAVQDAGGYIDWYCDEDYYLWLRMALNGCIMMNTGTTLVYARVGREMYNRRGGMVYYLSEARLQRFMLESGIIGVKQYIVNVSKRFVVQVMFPNWLRGWVYKKFARQKV